MERGFVLLNHWDDLFPYREYLRTPLWPLFSLLVRFTRDRATGRGADGAFVNGRTHAQQDGRSEPGSREKGRERLFGESRTLCVETQMAGYPKKMSSQENK